MERKEKLKKLTNTITSAKLQKEKNGICDETFNFDFIALK